MSIPPSVLFILFFFFCLHVSVLATGLRPRQRARCSLRRRPSTAPPSDADVDAMQRDTWTLEGSGGVGGGGGGGG